MSVTQQCIEDGEAWGYDNGMVAALAQAWLWVRDATTSEDEAGEMVVECLKKLGQPIERLEEVEKMATLSRTDGPDA